MRKYHRWLVVFTGIFLLWIAVTGFLGQVISVAQHGLGEEKHGPPSAQQAAAPAAAPGTKPVGEDAIKTAMAGIPTDKGVRCGPPRPKGGQKDLFHFIIDLHSGNYFGGIGKILSILMGAAMIFFTVSGMWMYLDMFRRRLKADKKGLFWK